MTTLHQLRKPALDVSDIVCRSIALPTLTALKKGALYNAPSEQAVYRSLKDLILLPGGLGGAISATSGLNDCPMWRRPNYSTC